MHCSGLGEKKSRAEHSHLKTFILKLGDENCQASEIGKKSWRGLRCGRGSIIFHKVHSSLYTFDNGYFLLNLLLESVWCCCFSPLAVAAMVPVLLLAMASAVRAFHATVIIFVFKLVGPDPQFRKHFPGPNETFARKMIENVTKIKMNCRHIC